MAEILGIVSGSITVAETASAVLKLKRLWNEVRDAPDYVDSLIDQLSLVHPLLAETETELRADEKLLASSSAARLSLNYCKKILWDLDRLAHDLRQQTESKRRLSRGKARMKVVLGKEAIRALQKRMQDALQLLGIAQQTYLIALSKSQPRLVVDQIRSLDTTTLLENEDGGEAERALISNAAKLRADDGVFNGDTLPWKYSWLFGSYTSHTCSTSDKAYHGRIQMPSWLANKAWDFCAQRASHGWTYSLRQWSVRPESAEIFDAAAKGDLARIVQLLENGQGSPYDRNPQGVTLLHHAASSKSQKTIAYLMGKGLSIDEPDTYGDTALDYLAHPATLEPQEIVDMLEVLWLLKSAGELTDAMAELFDLDATHRDYKIIGSLMFCASGIFDLVLEEFRLAPPEIRYNCIQWGLTDLKVLNDVLKADGINDPSIFCQRLSYRYGGSLHGFAGTYFLSIPGCSNNIILWQAKGTVFQDWRNFARWLLSGFELEELSSLDKWYNITPLFAGLQASTQIWRISPRAMKQAKNRLQQSLLFWVEDLKAAGVDLKKYGQQETRLLREESGWDFAEWNSFLETRGRPKLASFRYGPEPEDWELVWEEVFVEDFVGDFFSFAELPPLMPGAWVD
ncbi:hypothetical protein BJY00DRAFT_286287 [Aspergillus carlsbadensis]|nr:hypothetical protein BJY00DRAFT_286287 [Aspergillus carlsbadensis]